MRASLSYTDKWRLYHSESRKTFDIFNYIDRQQLSELDRLRRKAKIEGIWVWDRYVALKYKEGQSWRESFEWGYHLYREPLTAEEQKLLDDGCQQIFYKDNVMLYYNPSTIYADYLCIDAHQR